MATRALTPQPQRFPALSSCRDGPTASGTRRGGRDPRAGVWQSLHPSSRGWAERAGGWADSRGSRGQARATWPSLTQSARTLLVLVLVLKCTGRRFTLPPVKLSVEAQPEQRPVLGVPSRRDLSLSRPRQFIPHSRDSGPFHRHNRRVYRVVVFLPL